MAPIEVPARAGQGGNRGYRNMISKQARRSPGPAAAAIENNVVGVGLQREVEVVLDVLGGQFETNRYAATALAHAIGELAIVVRRVQIAKGRRRHCVFPLLELANLGDLALDLAARQMPAGAGLGALAGLEMKGLDLLRKFYSYHSFFG